MLLSIVFTQYTGFGQSIEDFTLPNVVNGTNFSLSTFKAEKAIVLIFYSGKCAYGEHYFERII